MAALTGQLLPYDTTKGSTVIAIGAQVNSPPQGTPADCTMVDWYPTPPPPVKIQTAGGASEQLQPVPPLPPELYALGLIRASERRKQQGNPPYGNRFQAVICGLTFFANDPWTDPDLNASLGQTKDGKLLLMETPCMAGYGRPLYHIYNLDKQVICTYVPGVNNPPDPFPDGKYVGGDPGKGQPFGHPPLKPGQGGGGGLPVTVGGLNVGDIAKFLEGVGAGGDVSGIVRVIAGLVLAAGGINSTLGDLAPGIGDALTPGLGGLASSLDAVSPGLGTRLDVALGGHADQGRTTAQQVGAFLLGAAPGAISPVFQALVDATGVSLPNLTTHYKDFVDGLLRRMLDLFRDHIEAQAPVHPGNVDKVAAAALSAALVAGSTAQLAGMAIELLHPIKSMGVQQAIGVLARFAGFEEIIKPFFGATLKHGMGQPAEHRAAAHFRSTLPPVELVRELAAIGDLDPNKYIERLEFAGYPEPYPGLLNDVRFTPPNARFLAQLLDGSETDKAWLTEAFRRLGFSPRNIDRGVRAMELKTTAPGRNKVVGTLLTEYRDGHIADADLEAGLEGAGLPPTHRAYYLRAAELERRGHRMEAIAKEALAQYTNNLIGEAALRQEFKALGFTEDEITVRVVGANLTLTKRQVGEEVKEIETEVKALKAKGLAAAGKQLRAGLLSLARYLTVGEGMGYDPAFLQASAIIALGQGTPKTTKAEPAIGAGALEEGNAKIAALLATEVELKRAARLDVLTQMRVLGLPQDLASELVDLAEAIAGPSHRPGDYGFPAGGGKGGAFGAVIEAVAGGLQGIPNIPDLVARFLASLGLPGRDRAALTRLIRDLRDLFGG